MLTHPGRVQEEDRELQERQEGPQGPLARLARQRGLSGAIEPATIGTLTLEDPNAIRDIVDDVIREYVSG